MTRQRVITAVITLAIAGAVAYQYSQRTEKSGQPSLEATGTPPEVMLKEQCSRCHPAPEPGNLPKEKWPFAIRWMGNYLGIQNIDQENSSLVIGQYVPQRPLIHPDDLARIESYLIERAPTQDQLRIKRARVEPTRSFTPQRSDWAQDMTLVTLLHIDSQRQRVLVGGNTPTGARVQAYGPDSRVLWEHPCSSEPITAENRKDGYRLTTMGAFEADQASAQILDLDTSAKTPSQRMLLNGGHRLTQHITGDIDQDGRPDLLVVGFGDGYGPGGLGRVSVFWATDGFDTAYASAPADIPRGHLAGALEEKTLMLEAGPLNAVLEDFDKDGLPDILLARAQGAQELILWRNKGSRVFEKIVVKQWFVGFGMNRVRAADFDNDQDLDLLVVSGNNMEFPDPPLRSYHGLRVLENQGKLRFTERYHFPMYGALDAVVRDFDNDGDPDIAAIAFFLDWEAPESFVYLENQGGMTFTASGLSDEHFGRWLRIDAGDVNADGTPDIVLGSARTNLGLANESPELKKTQRAPAVLILKNNL